MGKLSLFAIMASGALHSLPVPVYATTFDDLYQDMSLGVYSALRTYDHNKFLFLDEHLARTRQAIELLDWEYELDEMRLRRALHEISSNAPAPAMRVRFDILAEPVVTPGGVTRELIALLAFRAPSPAMYAEGVRLATAPELHRDNPLAKTADFAAIRHHYVQSQPEKAYEYLLLDKNGRILEGTGSNFYGVRDGVVYTAGTGVLEGITRRIILQLLPDLDIPLRLEPVIMSDLASLDEAAMSSSSRALLPVVKIDGQVIGNGRPGPIAQRILGAYNAFVASAIKPALGG